MSIKTVNITIDDLINKVKKYINNEDDIKLIREAFEYAKRKHFSQKRITGDDYISHPLNVALILTEIKADAKAISAALLHDTIEDSDSSKEEISELFGEDISRLVECVTKINKINFNSENEQMIANQRKILVGLSEDVRVIFIKLADRLHNMRTLYVMSEEKRKRKAKETLEILTPIAHRLGIYKIKSELEDLCLRYLNPDAYYDIVEKLNLKKTERDESVGKMLSEVSELLTEHNIPHEIKGRSKSIYSIYNKLNKGKKFKDIYDILALRVFVETEQECYLALGLIHSKYKPVPKRFKDYIAMPKTNLYQSLHTTVFGIDGQFFEIQIRTYEMDKIAEYGIASHWSYKENSDGSKKDAMEKKLQIFRSIIEINEDTSTPEEFISSMKKDILTNDSIYVYTPKGDVMELPVNATPVDFAYKVHSEVGDKMVSAIVNDNIVTFDYILKTGDVINIITNRNSKGPSKEWLNFAITTQAKSRIKSFFSKTEKDDNYNKGVELLEKEIKKKKLVVSEVLTNKNINTILDELNLKDINDLYIDIGSGKILSQNVLKIITKKEEKKDIINKINTTTGIKKKTNNNEVLVEGIPEIKINLSGCCKPIPGDNIVGYITKGSGITIHRTNCKNIIDAEERLVSVKWNVTEKKYETDLLIYTTNVDNLVEIITKASSNNITIDSIKAINKSDYKLYDMTILVENSEVLRKFLIDLESLPFVMRVERMIN